MPVSTGDEVIEVEVRLGESVDTHPIYETLLYFSTKHNPLVIKGQYKVYKALYDGMATKQDNIYGDIVTAEFPSKVSKSTKLLKGFQMNSEDLDKRCRLLHDWMRNLIRRFTMLNICLLYTSPSPRDATLSRMPSSA